MLNSTPENRLLHSRMEQQLHTKEARHPLKRVNR